MFKLIYPLQGVYSNDPVDVSIIIPLYKSFKVCQEQIQRWVLDSGLTVEIIYVDDKCPQKSKLAVCKSWEKRRDKNDYVIKMLLSSTNLGFGGASNLGAYHANGKYLIFLNADVIVTPNWITPIIELLKDEKVGIVGNLQLKDGGEWHGTIDSAGSEWSWEQMNFMHIGRHIYNGQILDKPYFPDEIPLEATEREMVTGCCIGIRKKLFEDIGGFNIRYKKGYWEDSELCLVVREKGYKVMFQPESIVYHKLHHSGCGNHAFAQSNRDNFYNKWVVTNRIDTLVKAKRNVKSYKVRNILIQRDAAYGDVLMAASIASAMKKKYPGSKIYFNTSCGDILKGNPDIDYIIKDPEVNKYIYQIRCNLNLAYERRPHTNILQAYADEAGVKIEDCQMRMGEELYDGLPEKYVVIHAGRTNWSGRSWIPDRFYEIAKRLKEKYFVVSIGRDGDHEMPCNLDLRGKTTMQQLATVMKNADFFVGIDSLPMHIAQATKTPGVCFFGCIDPQTRVINNNIKCVMEEGLKCLGCHHKKPAPSLATTDCPNNLECENLVTIERMWEEICSLNV